jgi:hypothetical protein
VVGVDATRPYSQRLSAETGLNNIRHFSSLIQSKYCANGSLSIAPGFKGLEPTFQYPVKIFES